MHEIYAARDPSSLKHLSIKKLIDPTECSIQFEAGTKQVKQLPLSEVLLALEPGRYLHNVTESKTVSGDADRISTYRIAPIPGILKKAQPRVQEKKSATIKGLNYVRAGRAKELHMTSAIGLSGYSHRLQQSYNHILDGSRVELHVHLDKKDVRTMTIDAVMTRSPHLRPEAIMGGMPTGTAIMHGPFWENKKGQKQLIWVMENEGNWLKETKVTGWHHTRKQLPQENALEILKNLPNRLDIVNNTTKTEKTQKKKKRKKDTQDAKPTLTEHEIACPPTIQGVLSYDSRGAFVTYRPTTSRRTP
ncbi:MAG: hypothetical protein Q9223_006875 [Gallowayella weberi]